MKDNNYGMVYVAHHLASSLKTKFKESKSDNENNQINQINQISIENIDIDDEISENEKINN